MIAIVAIASIIYFFFAIVLIIKLGLYGIVISYFIGMALGYFQMSLNGEKIERAWLFLAPIGLFMAGGIAGGFVLMPFHLLGVIPSSSGYVSDEEFWSRR